VLIWYLRGHAEAAHLVDSLPELSLSAIAWMELGQGCRNQRELDRLKRDFSRRQARVLPVSEAISERAVALVEAHFLGNGLLLADALIASTAIEYNLMLSSANSKLRDFSCYDSFSVPSNSPLCASYDPVSRAQTFHDENFRAAADYSQDMKDALQAASTLCRNIADLTKSATIYCFPGSPEAMYPIFDSEVEPLGQRCYTKLRTIRVKALKTR
jgi:predicted nucleic acid-binding protein